MVGQLDHLHAEDVHAAGGGGAGGAARAGEGAPLPRRHGRELSAQRPVRRTQDVINVTIYPFSTFNLMEIKPPYV